MRTWALWLLLLLCRLSWAALPAKPENISCVFYYKKNFTCSWSPERGVNDTWYRVKRTYNFGKSNDTHECPRDGGASCSFFHAITTPDNYCIQVQAQNADGVTESDITYWYLDSIAKMEPPVILSVEPVSGMKQMLQVKWYRPTLAPVSATLNCTLRFRAAHSASWMKVHFRQEGYGLPKELEGEQTYNLTGLQPFTEYIVALRCVAEESSFWSGWSQDVRGTTEEEAPLGLDVWRVLGPAQGDGRRPVKLLWKKRRGAPALEKVLGYHVQYFPENSPYLTETVNTTHQQLELSLGDRAYQVSVVSYNSLGQSPAATLRIPASGEQPSPCVEALHTSVSGHCLEVAWRSSNPNVDTWLVEWLLDVDSATPALSWEWVSQARNWTIQQDELMPFQCYNISVHPILQNGVGEPVSVQAYVQQGVPSAGPVAKVESIGVHSATITWTEVPKGQRKGFISNYTVFCQAEGGEGFASMVGPSTLQLGLESLTRGTPYTVQVLASTQVGGTNGTYINFRTLSISVLEICLITSLVGGGLLILVILTVGYSLKKPNKLKHLCWPRVPNPAESSIAMWRGDSLQNKLKQFDDTMSVEDERILKPCSVPRDLIDKLVVDFENFLEEVSIEESRKGQESVLGGEENEYVTSPSRPYFPPGKSSVEPVVATKAAPRKAYPLPSEQGGSTQLGAAELLLSSAQGDRLVCPCEDRALSLYLKNSVTTREFLASETLPDQTQREI